MPRSVYDVAKELSINTSREHELAIQMLMIELANDYRRYIPAEEAFAVGGYETWRAKSSLVV